METVKSRIERVLLVEDDPAFARLAGIALSECKVASVARAADAADGLKLLQRQAWDLLICDLSLPGKDGISFLKEVSQLPEPPPVVILSGADSALISAVEKLCRATGLVILAALQKPLDLDSLKVLLEVDSSQKSVPSESGTSEKQSVLVSDSMLDEGLQKGWFIPFLEPKIDRADGRVVGFELLARLCPPDSGVVGPAPFVQRLEERGLIEQMTWQIAERGFRFAGESLRAGTPFLVALNLSPTMLGARHLVDHLDELVRAAGLDPRAVTLEVTESAAIGAGGIELENLARLRLRGFGLSIDDFGTGHSSLAQLSRVPFSEMKIDRMFSASAPSDPRARAVAASCIELAHRMNMKSCAEGVESGEVFRLLYDLGADTFQGYLFHAPMPRDGFSQWVESWNDRVSIRELYLDGHAS